ncbi:MAG: hypothetical protein R3C10_04880 [Pirellulales bacterium]
MPGGDGRVNDILRLCLRRLLVSSKYNGAEDQSQRGGGHRGEKTIHDHLLWLGSSISNLWSPGVPAQYRILLSRPAQNSFKTFIQFVAGTARRATQKTCKSFILNSCSGNLFASKDLQKMPCSHGTFAAKLLLGNAAATLF